MHPLTVLHPNGVACTEGTGGRGERQSKNSSRTSQVAVDKRCHKVVVLWMLHRVQQGVQQGGQQGALLRDKGVQQGVQQGGVVAQQGVQQGCNKGSYPFLKKVNNGVHG